MMLTQTLVINILSGQCRENEIHGGGGGGGGFGGGGAGSYGGNGAAGMCLCLLLCCFHIIRA